MRRCGQDTRAGDWTWTSTQDRGKGQEGTSRVSNRIQKIGKSAEQSEGSRKAGTNRHQQLTYTSDSVASSAVPIRSSRTLTQEGKGHGRGRAAENQGPKRQEEAKRSKNGVQKCRNRMETFGKDSNRMRIGHLDQTRAGKPLIPIGRKGNTHTTTTTQHNKTNNNKDKDYQ